METSCQIWKASSNTHLPPNSHEYLGCSQFDIKSDVLCQWSHRLIVPSPPKLMLLETMFLALPDFCSQTL